MGATTRLFGDDPRVKLVEALTRLAGTSFTIPEAAREAGLQKNTTYRRWDELVAAGLVVPAGKDSEKYVVNPKEPRLRAADFFEASLQLLEDPTSRKLSEQTDGILHDLRVGLLQSAQPLFVIRNRADTSRPPGDLDVSGTLAQKGSL